MNILLFTFIFTLVTQLFNVSYLLPLALYLLALGLGKVLLGDDLKEDVFHLIKSKDLYYKVGLKDTLAQVLALALVVINYLLIDFKPLNALEYLSTLFVFLLVYRFLIWGISGEVREKTSRK